MTKRLLLEGPEIEDLLAQVRDDYGEGARIVSADRVRSGGVAGFFAKQRYELTVEIDDEPEGGRPQNNVQDFSTELQNAAAGSSGNGGPGASADDGTGARSVEDLVALANAYDRGTGPGEGPQAASEGAMRAAAERAARESAAAAAVAEAAGRDAALSEAARAALAREAARDVAREAAAREAATGEAAARAAEREADARAAVERAVRESTVERAAAEQARSDPVDAEVREEPPVLPLFQPPRLNTGTGGPPEPGNEQPSQGEVPFTPAAGFDQVLAALRRDIAEQEVALHAGAESAPAAPSEEDVPAVASSPQPAAGAPPPISPPPPPQPPPTQPPAPQPPPAPQGQTMPQSQSPQQSPPVPPSPQAQPQPQPQPQPQAPARPQPQPPVAQALPEAPPEVASLAYAPPAQPAAPQMPTYGAEAIYGAYQQQPAIPAYTMPPVPQPPAPAAPVPSSSVPSTPGPSAVPGMPPAPPGVAAVPGLPGVPGVPPPSALPARTEVDPVQAGLLALGVPASLVARVAGRDPYTAILHAFESLPPTPWPPTRPGDVLLIAGPPEVGIDVAGRIARAEQLNPQEILLAAGSTAGTGLHPSRRITGPADAQRRARKLHRADTPHLVVVATCAADEDNGDWVRAIGDALGAAAVWAVVDATRKPADTRRHLETLGPLHGLVVHGAGRTADPGTVLHLGIPVVYLDGRRVSPARWAGLLCERLEGVVR